MNSSRADLLFSVLSPVPGAWLTICWMNGSRVRKGGPSHETLDMSTCLHVSWDQRLPDTWGRGPSVGALQGASCIAGSDEKPPVSPGKRPARGGQAGGGEFLPAESLALTASSPLPPPALAYFRWISLPSVSSPRCRPSGPGAGSHTWQAQNGCRID